MSLVAVIGHSRVVVFLQRTQDKGSKQTLVEDSNPHLRTLHLALETLGGEAQRLASDLDISKDELEAYLQGEKLVPNPVFMAALDIVAYNRRPQ